MGTESDTVQSARRLTWNHCALIVFLTMILGVVLWFWRPVWLTPPLFSYTPLAYFLLALIWLPVWIVCALLRPAGRARVALLLVALGLLASVSWCLLLYPGGSTWLHVLDPAMVTCQQEAFGAGQVRHTCSVNALFNAYVYVLEGPEGWPFARLVEVRLINT